MRINETCKDAKAINSRKMSIPNIIKCMGCCLQGNTHCIPNINHGSINFMRNRLEKKMKSTVNTLINLQILTVNILNVIYMIIIIFFTLGNRKRNGWNTIPAAARDGRIGRSAGGDIISNKTKIGVNVRGTVAL